MFVFRISSAFVVVVLLSKSVLFVADDSKFLEVEALGAIEKRVGKLIDESIRDLREEKEREEEGERLSFAVRFVATRKAIVRCIDGVCAWVRSGARVVSAEVVNTARRAADVLSVHTVQSVEKHGLGSSINPLGDPTTT